MWESEELTPPSFSLPKQWPHPKEEQDARDSAQPESVFSPTTKEAIHSGPSGKILRLEAVSVELEKLPRTKPNTHRGKDKSLFVHLKWKMCIF
ncbi:hypothetical protein Lalb_Chr18g0050701 [Lupinus albus]|uniref:Uncharacterized protein n=1 Tax=Lupinus albus TaxID=3870 RepID=A0A6A4NTW9_LUPAL|nr:hypothetical protein Lalb_Chr18g0050701 [Lupinus albus]